MYETIQEFSFLPGRHHNINLFCMRPYLCDSMYVHRIFFSHKIKFIGTIMNLGLK